MMQAKELRIGNILQTHYGLNVCVSQINEMYIKASLADIGEQETNMWQEYYYNNLKPIPLTEDILVKLGAQKIDGWDDMIIYRVRNKNLISDVELSNIGFENDMGMIIKHVHHYQNYIHSTIGKELKLNNKEKE